MNGFEKQLLERDAPRESSSIGEPSAFPARSLLLSWGAKQNICSLRPRISALRCPARITSHAVVSRSRQVNVGAPSRLQPKIGIARK
jgi:hypothetical protein